MRSNPHFKECGLHGYYEEASCPSCDTLAAAQPAPESAPSEPCTYCGGVGTVENIVHDSMVSTNTRISHGPGTRNDPCPKCSAPSVEDEIRAQLACVEGPLEDAVRDAIVLLDGGEGQATIMDRLGEGLKEYHSLRTPAPEAREPDGLRAELARIATHPSVRGVRGAEAATYCIGWNDALGAVLSYLDRLTTPPGEVE